MKAILITISIFVSLFVSKPVQSQSAELEQLILNVEKLNQLRAILDNMYKGYEILTKGYNTIKELAEGNFSLHKLFLDGLLEVSPTVKRYKRIVEILTIQQRLVKEYKSALAKVRSANIFSKSDLDYIENVYENLLHRSGQNLEELLMVITSGQLRMNDAERLNAIDRIYADINDKLQFLRHFNNKTLLVAAQKQKSLREIQDLKRLYGINE